MTASPSSVVAVLVVTAFVSGCSTTDPGGGGGGGGGGSPTVAIARAPTASGNGQTAVVATALADPLQVLVTEDGSPVSGRTVAWSTTSGSVTDSSSTDASGIATTNWTLGQSSGSQSASATLSGANGSPVTFTATASAGAAAFIAKAGGDNPPQSGIINTMLTNPLIARATDQFNNPVSGVSVTWTSGMATPMPASGNTASNGEAETMVTLGGTAGPIIIQAMSTGLNGSPLNYSATALPLPSAVTVQVVENSFQPQDVTIAVGGIVTWNWPSSNADIHNVMPDVTGGPPLRSGDPTLGPNTHTHTFNTPGTYMYYCFVHGQPGGGIGMVGMVTVI